jgi:4'-phosphopantetheinyl transferase
VDDAWLTEPERETLAALRIPKRRADWRLGRWTAKMLVSALTGAPADRVAILAAADGAPEAFVDGRAAGVCISLSHRAGRAVAVAASAAVGCDLELVEPRSAAFSEDWLTPSERAWAAGDALRVNLVWSAKEAWLKLQREGLRLDPRSAEARPCEGEGDWGPLVISSGRGTTHGWWRADRGWIMTVVAEPAAVAEPRETKP